MVQALNKLLSLLMKTALLLVAVILLYLLAALAFFGLAQLDMRAVAKPAQLIPVYLFADAFHADLMIPINAMDAEWDYLLSTADFPVPREQVKLLSFGWGSREFYLKMREWDQLSLGLALKAMAYDATVMHVTAHRSDSVKIDHPMVYRRFIDQRGYQRLLEIIRRSHQLDQRKRAVPIPGMGYSDNDAFFVAIGRYHPLRTCNQWTGEALRQAGLKVALWAPFSFALMYSTPE